jgi:hypothetical protein
MFVKKDMEFTITEQIKKKQIPSGYYVNIISMFGDGDEYHTFTIGAFNTSDNTINLLPNLINTLKRMKELYPNGKGGCETYDSVEGFTFWFNEDNKNINPLAKSWAYNSDYDETASLNEYWVTFMDDNQNEFKVNITHYT